MRGQTESEEEDEIKASNIKININQLSLKFIYTAEWGVERKRINFLGLFKSS